MGGTAVNKEELFKLANYIVDTYTFIEIKYFDYIIAEKQYALIFEVPNGDEERVYGRAEWDLYHEPEAAAWKEWKESRCG